MALIYQDNINNFQSGKLEFKQKKDITAVYFTYDRTIYHDVLAPDKTINAWHLLDYLPEQDILIMYPFSIREEFCSLKYESLKSITLIGFDFDYETELTHYGLTDLLSGLPSSFVKDYNYGLGLKKDYVSLIRNMEKIGAKHLIVNKAGVTGFDESSETLTLKFSEFDTIRKGLNRAVESCRSVANFLKDKRSSNYLSYFLDDPKFPQQPVIIDNRLISRLVEQTETKLNSLTSSNDREAISMIKQHSVRLVREQPEALMKLKNDLELVTLSQLIERFEENLYKRLNEDYWQGLFNANPFILTLAFGYPIIKINDQASVGGHKIDRSGEKIVDFLVKNSFSQNIALFEIKTPGAKLLNSKPYRDGVYQPAADLTGAVNQVLDQKYHLERSISYIKENSRIFDLETYAVNGILIAGLIPQSSDQLKSFELYRNNSKSVQILTFDEVLNKLKQLLVYLSSAEPV